MCHSDDDDDDDNDDVGVFIHIPDSFIGCVALFHDEGKISDFRSSPLDPGPKIACSRLVDPLSSAPSIISVHHALLKI